MRQEKMWQEIARKIAEKTATQFVIEQTRSVGGGCINQAYQIQGKDKNYFVKLNQASRVEMFQAEALGLRQMYATKTITIPEPICWGIAGDSAYLVLEWLELGRGNNSSWLEMGKQLALMHYQGTTDKFGWELNNTIGSTPQINTWMDNWADFFAEQRIGYQLRLAKRKGGNFPDSEAVLTKVRNKLAERNPEASIIHGDLWSGNADITVQGLSLIHI